MAAEAPPTLLSYEPPLLVEGPEEVRLIQAEVLKRVSARGTAAQINDVVNSILPPRMWKADGATWMQYVSKAPATRQDATVLEEALDARLAQRMARDAGLCPVRDELYKQTFDELIRQVTLDLPERGLLMLRIRDEIRMTLDAYRVLYDASVTFGVRKHLQAEQGLPELEGRLTELTDRKKVLETQVSTLRTKLDVLERRQVEKRALDEKRRADEITYLRHQGKHMDAFMKSMTK